MPRAAIGRTQLAFTSAPMPDRFSPFARRSVAARTLISGGSGALTALTLAIALVAQWLTAYRDTIPSAWDPFAPLVLSDVDTPVQRWKLTHAAADPGRCLAALTAAGAEVVQVSAPLLSDRCSRDGALSITAIAGLRLAAVDLRCPLALRLAAWHARVVQPAAAQHLGQRITGFRHYGGYACRRIAGSMVWSQHATANAFDIAAFTLEAGGEVSLTDHWGAPGESAEADFLRAVRDGGCSLFSALLGPEFNAAHEDHFHLDLGRFRVCR